MTVREKLLEELGCAIAAIFGDIEEEEFTKSKVSSDDIDAIAHKVKFYMDLN